MIVTFYLGRELSDLVYLHFRNKRKRFSDTPIAFARTIIISPFSIP
jgi:hypothetical protein